MHIETSETLKRDWKTFLLSPEAATTLRLDISSATMIVHSTIINGARAHNVFQRTDADFQRGADLALDLINFFFSRVFKDLGHFQKHPEMIHRFQDIGTGWKFLLNDEDYMEVHLV